MGLVVSAGWAVVRKGETIALCRTKRAAMRRTKAERAAGREAHWVELFYSSGLKDDAG